jgi:ferredoxin
MASPVGVRVNTATGQTEHPNVFAAGSAVKPVKQLVRAMSEGQAAAECLHQFLVGLPIRPLEKAFSSVMGRLDPRARALPQVRQPASRAPCPPMVVTPDSPRRSPGRGRPLSPLRLPRRGQLQPAALRRTLRREPEPIRPATPLFEQQHHPARVIFEPGKCILCGICIHIAKQAAEPLGLTFVGRGFNVQVAARSSALLRRSPESRRRMRQTLSHRRHRLRRRTSVARRGGTSGPRIPRCTPGPPAASPDQLQSVCNSACNRFADELTKDRACHGCQSTTVQHGVPAIPVAGRSVVVVAARARPAGGSAGLACGRACPHWGHGA